MARYIRSLIIDDNTPAADGTVSVDLPVNPVSFIDLTIQALNVTDEATAGDLADLLTAVTVSRSGTTVFHAGSGDDFHALNYILNGRAPLVTSLIATDNATRTLGCRIPFGRKPYDPAECFPATRNGEFTLDIAVDIATAEADGLILQVEAVELPDATPTAYTRVTRMSQTPAATGDIDFDLPTGERLLGIAIFSTTVPATTAWTTSADTLKVLVDNQEWGVASSKWETLHANLVYKCPTLFAQNDTFTVEDCLNWAYIDFDPLMDGSYILDTAGHSSVKLRVTAGDTNAITIYPVWLVNAR